MKKKGSNSEFDIRNNRNSILYLVANVVFLVTIGLTTTDNLPLLVLIVFYGMVSSAYLLYAVHYGKSEASKRIKAITHRVKRAGHHAFDHLPIGILVYDTGGRIVWVNRYLRHVFARDLLYGAELKSIDERLFSLSRQDLRTFEFSYAGRIYLVKHLISERVMYFTDVTEHRALMQEYKGQKAVIAILVLDNYEEAVRNLSETEQNDLRRKVVDKVTNWASEHDILLRLTRNDRYMLLMTHQTLEALCENKFTILDEVRKVANEQEIVITISIGIASGYDSYLTLESRASSMLDLALSRGGDQVVIKKRGLDDFLFFGGKTNPVARQSRVRARVNAVAYQRLVLDSDLVVVMGHRMPDADAIGASIGLFKIADRFEKEAYIVLNEDELDETNEVFVSEMLKDEKLSSYFISSEEALSKMTKDSLLVVVDTQVKNMVIDERLLGATSKVAVFDHHRRGKNNIEATLTYTDPSISSAAELVVDMFDYFSKKIYLNSLEASIMLAGIVLDTRRFLYNTSRKTYETAANLKQRGADEKVVINLLKSPISNYYARAHLTHRAEVFEGIYLITTAEDDLILDRTQLAISADDLLNVRDIKATFAIARIDKENIAVSARSIGDVNVQLIMENMGGGGHLNNAATQVSNSKIADVVTTLKAVLLESIED